MPLSHLLLILAINLVWGANFVVTKVVFSQIPPVLFASLRFVLVFVILLPWLKPIRGKMILVGGIALTMGALHFTLIYLGLARTDNVSSVAVATQLAVPFSTILSVIFLNDKVGWRRSLGIALAFSGILVLGFDPAVIQYLDALSFVVVGAMIAAIGMVFMKKLGAVSVFQIQAWIAALSWPLLVGASFYLEQGQLGAILNADAWVWGVLAFSALGASLLGHGGMYWLLQRHDISLVAPTTLLATVFGVALSIVFLNDELTGRLLIGGLISLVGVLMITLRQPQRGPAPMLDQPSVPVPVRRQH